MNWTLMGNKYSTTKMIILFLILFYFSEYIIVNVVNIDLEQVTFFKRIIMGILTIFFHELFHFLIALCVVKNKGKIWFGTKLKKMSVYMNVDGEYNYSSLIIYTIGPFILLSILFALFMYIQKVFTPFLWIIVFYNSFISVRDIYNAFLIISGFNINTQFKLDNFRLYYRNKILG